MYDIIIIGAGPAGLTAALYALRADKTVLVLEKENFGGQITFVAMLPVILISYRHGMKWGFVASFTYALIEMVIGGKTVAAAFQPGSFGDGTMIGNAIIMCALDYLVAYTLLGLGGIFRNRVEKPGKALMLGSIVAIGARYVSHVASGYILFSGWAEWYFTQEGFPAWGAQLVSALSPEMLGFTYSLVYNGMYILPEMIFTAIAALFLTRAPHIVEKVN
jgi:thiamine transporter